MASLRMIWGSPVCPHYHAVQAPGGTTRGCGSTSFGLGPSDLGIITGE